MDVVVADDEMVDSDDESHNSFTDLIDTDEADSDDDKIIDTEQHEEKETVERVWRMIGYRSCMKKVDVLSTFMFFYQITSSFKI